MTSAILLLLFLLVFALTWCFVMLSSVIGFIFTRVPYVRTRKADIKILTASFNISKNDVFYDLGCGDGKVIFGVEKLTSAQVKGIEFTLWTYLLAKIKGLILRSKAQFKRGNFFKYNWSDATIIYCYLFPHVMNRILDKAKAECAPGTKIISRDFQITNWKSQNEIKTNQGL